jgi:hypothetical protein
MAIPKSLLGFGASFDDASTAEDVVSAIVEGEIDRETITTSHICIYCKATTFLLEGICISRETCLSLGSFIPIQGEGPRGGVCSMQVHTVHNPVPE